MTSYWAKPLFGSSNCCNSFADCLKSRAFVDSYNNYNVAKDGMTATTTTWTRALKIDSRSSTSFSFCSSIKVTSRFTLEMCKWVVSFWLNFFNVFKRMLSKGGMFYDKQKERRQYRILSPAEHSRKRNLLSSQGSELFYTVSGEVNLKYNVVLSLAN